VAWPKNSPAVRALSLWCGILTFFFSPDMVHAEFLDRLESLTYLPQSQYQQLDQIPCRRPALKNPKPTF
jgi:hypothetical protein